MVATLKKFLSSRGDILADDRSNTLIIRDIPSTSAGDGQPDPPARPQIAAGGNRSARRGGEPHLLARNRHAAWLSQPPATTAATSRAARGGVGTSPVIRNFPPLPAASDRCRHGRHRARRPARLPLITNLGVGVADERHQLLVLVGQFRSRRDHHGGGRAGRRQAALEAEGHHAEQPEGDRQAGNQDSGADDRQQHGFRAVRRRGAASWTSRRRSPPTAPSTWT